ncbi:hypothetical protein [Hydrogenophaga sp. BPS33]|uniref:hypothetical protein n=1 Tax=Hydrogenophaga sp. BPS33 TaxID=2651974 RepID=UPI0013203E87|nr:hypothetical protein [Hydrogenophaga sp. BPS33]QHE84730.1 hypothetical protein F9K07_07455 [Hydrogenophaga sp. BPS33]
MLNLPFFLRPGRRAFLLLAALSLLGGAVHAQTTLRPQKTEHYRPFAITSSKLKTEIPDTFIFDKLMCRSTLDNLAEFMDILKNYDLLRSNAMDGTMSMTTFRGRQGGRPVEVLLAVQTSDRNLMHVLVDGQFALTCR